MRKLISILFFLFSSTSSSQPKVEADCQNFTCVRKSYYLEKSVKNYNIDSLKITLPFFVIEIDSFKNGLKHKAEFYRNPKDEVRKTIYYFYNSSGYLIKEIETDISQMHFRDSVKFSYNEEGKLINRTVFSNEDGRGTIASFIEDYSYSGDTVFDKHTVQFSSEEKRETFVLKKINRGDSLICLPSNADSTIGIIKNDIYGNTTFIKNSYGTTIFINKYDNCKRLILKMQTNQKGELESFETYEYISLR